MKTALLLLCVAVLRLPVYASAEDGGKPYEVVHFEWVVTRVEVLEYRVDGWRVHRTDSLQVYDIATCKVADGEHAGMVLTIALDRSERPEHSELLSRATVDIPDFKFTLDAPHGIFVEKTKSGFRDIVWKHIEESG